MPARAPLLEKLIEAEFLDTIGYACLFSPYVNRMSLRQDTCRLPMATLDALRSN
jgi:hypothetical protein